MDAERQTQDAVNWLKTIGAIVFVALLLVMYFVIPENPDDRVLGILLQLIPEAILILLAVVFGYFVFFRRGLTDEQLRRNPTADEIVTVTVKKLQNGLMLGASYQEVTESFQQIQELREGLDVLTDKLVDDNLRLTY